MAALYNNFSELEIKKIFKSSRTKSEFLKKLGYKNFSKKMYDTIVKKYNLSKVLDFNLNELINRNGGVYLCDTCKYKQKCLPEKYHIYYDKNNFGSICTIIQAVCKDYFPDNEETPEFTDFLEISSRNLLKPIVGKNLIIYKENTKWEVDNEEFFLQHKKLNNKEYLKFFLKRYGNKIIEKVEEK